MSTQNDTNNLSRKLVNRPKTRREARKHTAIDLSHGTVRALSRLLDDIAEHLGVAQAGLSLFDDRRAHYRLTKGFEAGSPKREEVVCNQVFSGGEPIVCVDVLDSPELASYPIVEQESIRFYAGVPLHDENGSTMGVICGWERTPLDVPTPFTLKKIQELAFLASTLIQAEVRIFLSEQEKSHWQEQAILEAQLLDIKGDAAVLISEDLRITYATPLFLELVQRRADELLGLKLGSFLESSTPIDFQACINQVSAEEPTETAVRLRSKGGRSTIRRMRVHRSQTNSQYSGDPDRHTHYAVVFNKTPGLSSSRSPAQFRRQLIQATRHGLSGEDRLDKIVSLVNSRVRGSENVTIVSLVTGPKTRKILHQQKDAPFIKDLGQHHNFDTDVSICATTATSNRYIFCPDSLLEDRWPDYEWLFYAHGIRSVWCMPVPADEGLSPGLLSVFRREAGAPDATDLETLEECAEWVSTLLLNDEDLPESPNPPTTPLQYLERQVHKALENASETDQCFLVSLNASRLLEDGATESRIQELISLHFGHPQTVFKMRHDLWCWIFIATDPFLVQGAMEKLDAASISLSPLSSRGRTEPHQRLCAYVQLNPTDYVTTALASLGRQLMGGEPTRSLAE
jgi:GAF domain-containing protein